MSHSKVSNSLHLWYCLKFMPRTGCSSSQSVVSYVDSSFVLSPWIHFNCLPNFCFPHPNPQTLIFQHKLPHFSKVKEILSKIPFFNLNPLKLTKWWWRQHVGILKTLWRQGGKKQPSPAGTDSPSKAFWVHPSHIRCRLGSSWGFIKSPAPSGGHLPCSPCASF